MKHGHDEIHVIAIRVIRHIWIKAIHQVLNEPTGWEEEEKDIKESSPANSKIRIFLFRWQSHNAHPHNVNDQRNVRAHTAWNEELCVPIHEEVTQAIGNDLTHGIIKHQTACDVWRAIFVINLQHKEQREWLCEENVRTHVPKDIRDGAEYHNAYNHRIVPMMCAILSVIFAENMPFHVNVQIECQPDDEWNGEVVSHHRRTMNIRGCLVTAEVINDCREAGEEATMQEVAVHVEEENCDGW